MKLSEKLTEMDWEARLEEARARRAAALKDKPPEQLSADAREALEEREAARGARDWARADALREQLAHVGYVIEDTPEGPRWRRA